MFVLHVDLKVKPGAQQTLEDVWRRTFRPAIASQPGFVAVELLRPLAEGAPCRLTIAFAEQSLQQHWVATDLHQQVWAEIENHCSGYSAQPYTAVSL